MLIGIFTNSLLMNLKYNKSCRISDASSENKENTGNQMCLLSVASDYIFAFVNVLELSLNYS